MRRILIILWMLCFGLLSAQTYHIGDVYTAPDGSQGIVYYLHPDGSGAQNARRLGEMMGLCVKSEESSLIKV